MLDGDFAKHLRRMHKHYAARRQVLLSHLEGDLFRWLDPIIQAAGIHLVARLKPPLAEHQVIAAARDAGIGIYGISPFHAGPRVERGLLFGYGGIDAKEIDTALARLAVIGPSIVSCVLVKKS